MTDRMLQTQIDAATAYEEFFVPALFQEWAPRVVAAAQLKPGQRVLDVACGTGVLAREAALCVGDAGAVVGLDPNPGMLTVARRLASGVEWREGTAEALPYPDQFFDAVLRQFGLMFFTDRREAIHEMVRVLANGGYLIVAVWDSLDNIPADTRLAQSIEQQIAIRILTRKSYQHRLSAERGDVYRRISRRTGNRFCGVVLEDKYGCLTRNTRDGAV